MTNRFNKKLALFLLDMCDLTYKQYHNDGKFPIPKGFHLVKTFKATAFFKREWFGFILESKDAVIIAFRGTQSDPDWIADGEAFQDHFPFGYNTELVHHGFLSIYQSCRDTIFNTYSQLSPHKKLYITGHSLGAALATLHAMDAVINSHFKKVNLYNYGSPRVGDDTFAKQFDIHVPHSIRFVNTNDIVPMLPPETMHYPFSEHKWYYKHVNHPVSFSIQKWSLSGNHSPETYREGINMLS